MLDLVIMNILFTSPMHDRFHVGGLAYSCGRITRGLALLGHRVTVGVFDAGHQYSTEKTLPKESCRVEDGGVTLEYFPAADSVTGAFPETEKHLDFDLQQAYLRLGIVVERHKPDVIVCFFPIPMALPASLVTQQRSIPLLLAFRGNDIGRFAHDPGVLPILQQALRTAAACTFLATDLRDLAAAIVPLMPPSTIIYNGIEPAVLDGVWPAVNDQNPVFGSVGVFKPKKGIEVFLQAIQLLGLHERALLVGDFMKSNSSRGQFSVSITGTLPRQSALEHLKRIDVFVAPSTTDGCPNAVLEAMAAGRAIITSRVGAMRDLLRDNESAYFLSDWSVGSMTAALSTLDQNHELRRVLGEGARAVAASLTLDRELAGWDAFLQGTV